MAGGARRHWLGDGPRWAALSERSRRMNLGADEVRGGEGPLVSRSRPDRTPFTEAFIKAGEQLGVPRREDLNRPDQEGVGYATWTIWRGRRVSAGGRLPEARAATR